MSDCLFCKIINKEIKSKTVYEDDDIKVFMDANPDANGHMLVVPKKHINDFTELDDETAVSINNVVKKMEKIITSKLKPDGIRLINNYGCYQMIKHYHLHIIPCYEPMQPLVDIDIIFDKLTK